jgi:hypothetical protein
MPTTVWAPDPLPELGGRVGFVQIEDEALAADLLESDKVQRPAIGAMHMRAPAAAAPAAPEPASDPATYGTRELTPARAPRQARSKKESE